MNLLSNFSFKTPSDLFSFITLPDCPVSTFVMPAVILIFTALVLFSLTVGASTDVTLATPQNRETTRDPSTVIDLFFYRNAGRHVGLGVGIICDRNDSTGASLLTLSQGKEHTLTDFNGVHGIKIVGANSLINNVTSGELELVKFPVFTAVLLSHQASGVVITSLGQPITSTPGYQSTITNLLVR